MAKKIFIGIALVAFVICALALAQGKKAIDETKIGVAEVKRAQLGVGEGEGGKVIPWHINYQGYLTDISGSPITDTLSMTFSIWDSPSGGQPKWADTHTGVVVDSGLFNEVLGISNPIRDSVFTPGQSRWLQLEVAGQTLSPRTEITSVGYAYSAENAFKIQNKPVSSSNPSLNQVLKWTGSEWAPREDSTGGAVCDTATFLRYQNAGGLPIKIDSCSGDAMQISYVGHYGIDIDHFTMTGIDIDGGGLASYGIAIGDCISGMDIWTVGAADAISIDTDPGGDGIDIGAGSCGLWVDSGNLGIGIGAVGRGVEASSETNEAGWFETEDAAHYAVRAENWYGSSNPGLYVDGYLTVTGTKSSIVVTSRGKEALFCVESPEVEFMSSGTAHLGNGKGYVEFDRLFSEAISTDIPVKVIVTPAEECNGICVVSRDSKGFRVKELLNGDSDAGFDWIVIARRKGYETRPDVLIPDAEAERREAMSKRKERQKEREMRRIERMKERDIERR